MQELEENIYRQLVEGFTSQSKTSGEVIEERVTNGGRWGLSLPNSKRNQVTAVWNFWAKPASLSSDWKLAKVTASFCDFSGWRTTCFLRRDSRGVQGTNDQLYFSVHSKLPETVLKPSKQQGKHTELLLQRKVMFDKHFRVLLKKNLKEMRVQRSNSGACLKF